MAEPRGHELAANGQPPPRAAAAPPPPPAGKPADRDHVLELLGRARVIDLQPDDVLCVILDGDAPLDVVQDASKRITALLPPGRNCVMLLGGDLTVHTKEEVDAARRR